MMKEEPKDRIGYSRGDDQSLLFAMLEVPWERSREEIWTSLAELPEPGTQAKVIRFAPAALRYAAAAVLLLIISITTLMRFYTTTVQTGPGKQQSFVLPDQSTVELHASSVLKYHPYWWRFARKVEFGGDALFLVEKGSTFSVISTQGVTTVLGTSFHVNARGPVYEVACLTGKVRVNAARSRDYVILNPNEKAVLTAAGTFEIHPVSSFENEIPQSKSQFFFTNTPLSVVLDEMERHYGIRIEGSIPPEAAYTGNFSRDLPVDQVMKLIGVPFNIHFVHTGNNVYQLKNNR